MSIERLKFRGKLSRAINNFNAAYEKIPKGTWMYTGFGETEGWEKMTYEEQYAHLTVVTFFQWVESRIIDPATVGQWTGLKDKNGVDIYEGDVLHWENDADGQSAELTIRWTEYNTCFQACDDVNRRYFLGLCGDIARNSLVIGNIHDEAKHGD